MINQIICLFIPSIIALYINEQTELYKGIRYYLMHVMLVNLFSYIITVYIFEQPYIEFTYMFTIKYLILSIMITLLMAQTEKQYIKYLNVEVRMEENENKGKKERGTKEN
ncbi:MAG: hypothetical protein J6J36_00170 [Clostridia bacterium]|nr:hypothetical protein [Clostridia bacterium]